MTVTIADDGPGFTPEVMDSLGEPYLTTRPARNRRSDSGVGGGLGLGFFIAKTLLERSGAALSFENRQLPGTGAVVQVSWPRADFVGEPLELPEYSEHAAPDSPASTVAHAT